jgi:DNA-binding NarL/FixJ family response regulator
MLQMTGGTTNADEFHDRFTRREVEILNMLASGMGNKQIAHKREISQKTISNRLCSIYQDLGISDRSQAVLCAVRRGLVNA